MKYFVPSKTFLTGEYSVLVGGAALGLATAPCFEISYLKQDTPNIFHPQSPAGRYLQKHNKSIGIHFHDPHMACGVQGGFGRSTAEYLAVVLADLLQNSKNQKENPAQDLVASEVRHLAQPVTKASAKSPMQVRDEYLSFFENEKVKPSGVDLLIQYLGEVTYVDPETQECQTLHWKFPELGFFVVATGLKIKTHEHLEGLDLQRIKDLPGFSNQVIDAYLNKKVDRFLTAMRTWCETLNQRKLTHLSSVGLRADIEKIENVCLAKPCGALGADVMLVFFEQQHKEQVQAELRQRKLRIQASREDITEGLVKYVG